MSVVWFKVVGMEGRWVVGDLGIDILCRRSRFAGAEASKRRKSMEPRQIPNGDLRIEKIPSSIAHWPAATPAPREVVA
jgi:hypothetical protein